MPHRSDIPQITGDLPLSVQGPFAPSDVFQPLLESFSAPRSDPLPDSVPSSTTYASGPGYGYEATPLSGGTQNLYPTQHWNSPLPSPSPSLPYVAHAGMLSANTPSTYSPSAAQAYISQMPSHLHPHPAPDRSVHTHDTPSAARSPPSEAPAMTTLRAPAVRSFLFALTAPCTSLTVMARGGIVYTLLPLAQEVRLGAPVQAVHGLRARVRRARAGGAQGARCRWGVACAAWSVAF